jgi:lipoyl-dependent peroxiredoxin subunit D
MCSGNHGHEQHLLPLPAPQQQRKVLHHASAATHEQLWSLVVSAIDGCGKCVSSHEKVLLAQGVSEELILAGARIHAVVNGTAAALDALA